MAVSDKIIAAIEEAFRDEGPIPSTPAKKKGTPERRHKKVVRKPRETKFELTGYPITMPLKWDDLGLGLVRSMGFVPNRPVRLQVEGEKWVLTGARTSSSILLWMLGVGGLAVLYFLQDLLYMVREWSGWPMTLVVVLPTLMNLFVRVRSFEFCPHELEFLGYDSERQLLVLSTLTQPGGVVAMRLDLPTDDRSRRLEEARVVQGLRHAHTGFIFIDGMANPDFSKLKEWSARMLPLAIVLGLYYYF